MLRIYHLVLACAATFNVSMIAWAQENTDPSSSPKDIPPACLEAFENTEKWVECAQEADPGTPLSMHAYSNLGAQAFSNSDFESAARFFDLSTPASGGETQLDAFAHALRASTYWRVGADVKAINHANYSVNWIEKGILGADKPIELNDDMLEPLLEVLTPVMTYLEMPRATDILQRYQQLPLTSLTDAARRAGVLASIEEFDAALLYSAKAVTGQPENPLYLNSHCNLLTRMGEAETALAFCDSALEYAPKNADIHFTQALTLASLGRCDEAWSAQSKASSLAPRYPLFKEVIACKAKETEPSVEVE